MTTITSSKNPAGPTPETVGRGPRKKLRAKSAPARTPDMGQLLRPVARVYLALARRFSLGLPPCDNPASLNDADAVVSPAIERWLENMDERVAVHQIRQLFQTTELSTEENLRTLIQHYLRKPGKSVATRDKVDFLFVQYLFSQAPERTLGQELSLADVARILQPVLGEVPAQPKAWLSPLEKLSQMIEECPSLGRLLDGGCLDQGRQLKAASGDQYFQPSALVAFAHFNFALRRAFFRLVQAEVIAVREALHALQLRGVSSVDCSTAGLSAEESIALLHQACAMWQQPFRAPYSAGRPFEQFVAVRACVEKALQQIPCVTSPAAQVATQISTPALPEEVKCEPSMEDPALIARAQTEPAASTPAASPADMAPAAPGNEINAPASLTELDSCLAKIAQQINTAGAIADRAASSVLYNGARLLLHSWEGEAFRRNGDEASDALRHAVASRAILAAAVDAFSRSENPAALDAAVALAERHVAQLQETAARARSNKQIEDAVNLSASSKRLLASVDKAKKLRTKSA